jgi:iron complex outermembrane receptor protein
VHYEKGGWRYAVNVVNLTDKTYVTSCSSLAACYYGERLRVTGSVAYKW